MTHTHTELVFILDRSGSIGGFNSTLLKQKREPGEALITTVLFDDQYELLHDRIPIQAVAPITETDYYVRGGTPLLDAVGKTIQKIANTQRQTAADYRADKVLFVIITDGMENASREYSYRQIKSMVTREKEEYGWEFLFLGANIDAAAEAGRFGINANRAVTFHADSQGVELNYQVLSDIAAQFRSSSHLADCYMAPIVKDFKKRKSQRS